MDILLNCGCVNLYQSDCYSHFFTPMKNVLEVDGVELHYGSRDILRNIYFKTETGIVTAVMGRNGCGKSSLFQVIFGEIDECEKSVRINGNMLFSNERNPRDMVFLPQFNYIPKSLKVKQVFSHYGLSFADFSKIFTDFKYNSNLKIGKLSGGNIRIIEVYLILMSDSKFCILDEPFSHIAPKEIMQFVALIENVKHKKGIIVSDHLYKYVKMISDNLYVIENGRSCPIKNEEQLRQYGY